MSKKQEQQSGQDLKVDQQFIVLTDDQILDADDVQIEWVPCPEWAPKGTPEEKRDQYGVFVRGLSGVERDRFEESCLVGRGKKRRLNLENARAKLVALCAVNSPDPVAAVPIFKKYQVQKLGEKSAQALQRIFEVAQRLSGLSDDQLDELTENLEDTQSGDFG